VCDDVRVDCEGMWQSSYSVVFVVVYVHVRVERYGPGIQFGAELCWPVWRGSFLMGFLRVCVKATVHVYASDPW
jgi:hypothetical protein